MSQSTLDDIARLLLRLVLGILILLHGWAKVTKGVSGIEGMLVAKGLPAFVAWGVYIGEVLAPVLMILGVYTRVAAGLIAVNMLVAIVLAHAKDIFLLASNGGWRLELQGMFLVAALAVLLLGAGRYALAGRNGRWN